MLGELFTNVEKRVSDGYKVILPVEAYRSYEAYNSSSLNLKKSGNVTQVDKSTTQYYQPVMDKEFDFVINPTILKPVIQVMYEINVVISREKKQQTNSKEYIWITPTGDVKALPLK